jgi:hypothetical protein
MLVLLVVVKLLRQITGASSKMSRTKTERSANRKCCPQNLKNMDTHVGHAEKVEDELRQSKESKRKSILFLIIQEKK